MYFIFADDITATHLSNTKIDVVYTNCPNMKKLIVRTKYKKKGEATMQNDVGELWH